MDDKPPSTSPISRLKRWFSSAPETQEELLELITRSQDFLEPSTVDMLEGVLELPATHVREIMTPRTQMVELSTQDGFLDIVKQAIDSAHSRYPVVNGQNTDEVVGILLVKDLLGVLGKEDAFDLKKLLRRPLFVSETARCDTLLRALQKAQTHLAVVLDEFGGVCGVVTMEDLLEEIVGDIIDEHDDVNEDSSINHITPDAEAPDTWRVVASTPVADVNDKLGTTFDDADIDSMGGLVLLALGQVSDLAGQSVEIDGWRITIMTAHGRAIDMLRLSRLAKQE